MTSPHPHPRRRYITKDVPTFCEPSHNHFPSRHVVPIDEAGSPLKKSATFHSPKSPPTPEHDPILNFPSLPRRSPTCPRALEAVAAGEKRIAQLLGAVDRSLIGLERFSTDSQETLRAEDLPVPRFVLDAHVPEPDAMDVDRPSDRTQVTRQRRKHHASDSGIGSSITGSEDSWSGDLTAQKLAHLNMSAQAPTAVVRSGINGRAGPKEDSALTTQNVLNEYACRQIQKHIILPIVREDSLKSFHSLVKGIPQRVGRKEITCLRDLEKVLLLLAPKWSESKASFLNFCYTSIQCIHTTVDYLSDREQRRPTDRPYTNGYFLDLREQIRQYAAELSAARERRVAGIEAEEDGFNMDDTVRLEGGLSRNGRPAELVRIRNGHLVSLRTGNVIEPEEGSFAYGHKRSSSEDSDDDIMRSMARRRKNAQAKALPRCPDCEKEFKRPCDLTKHEKTHTRPWKCSDSSCKYHTYGWPTEKERDRHVNDKHSTAPSMFKCQYHPCPYESKRESNCKQHMEKAHGWAYVRSKHNGRKPGKKLEASHTPPTPQMPTPSSDIFVASSPEWGGASSVYSGHRTHSVAPSLIDSTAASDDSGNYPMADLPLFPAHEPIAFDPTLPWDDSFNGLNMAGPANLTPDPHRLSIATPSMTTDAQAMPSALASADEDLFNQNFDWSNMDTNFSSFNIQLNTPASSIDNRPMDAYSRNPSLSLDHPLDMEPKSLSPGAQGNAMLYSPYSQNDMPVDEGYHEFSTDLGKPSSDFALFDSRADHSMDGAGNGQMFDDLPMFVPAGWSGRSTDNAHQLGSNDLMRVDGE